MKDSFLNDTCKTFYDNGQLKAIEIYSDTKKEGEWRYFSNAGSQTKTEFYKNDNLVSSKE